MAPKALPFLQATFLLLLVVLSWPLTIQSKPSGQSKLFNFILNSEGQDVSELLKFKGFGYKDSDDSGFIDSKSSNKNDEFDHLLHSWESNCYLKITRIFGSLLIILNLAAMN
jgi:hypothetical protein